MSRTGEPHYNENVIPVAGLSRVILPRVLCRLYSLPVDKWQKIPSMRLGIITFKKADSSEKCFRKIEKGWLEEAEKMIANSPKDYSLKQLIISIL